MTPEGRVPSVRPPAVTRLALLGALVVCACPGPSVMDGGTGGSGGGDEEFLFDVSGTAAMYPEGIGLLADAGRSTSVAGLTVRVEEPLRVATNDPLGYFSTTVLDSTGAFSATMISDQLVSLGVAAGVIDDAGVRAVRSATVLWDVAFEQKKPDKNITGAKAWVFPVELEAALTAAVTEAQILSITGANQKRTLSQAGCILGRVINASGAPVSGATVVPTKASLASHFFYPTADLTGTGAATSTNGLFIFIHDGSSSVEQFSFDVMGATGYRRRSAGARDGACLIATVYPGDTAPP